jgi:hypothetical protein
MKAWQLVKLGWCQHAYAKSDKGRSVTIGSPSAARWCAIGAMTHVYGIRGRELCDAENRLRNQIGTEAIHFWNDAPSRTQAEVVAAMKEADV